MAEKPHRTILLVLSIALGFTGVLTYTPSSSALPYDDFEDESFDRWQVISGQWEIVSEGSNHEAHLMASTTWGRRMVSRLDFAENVLLTVQAKGNCHPSDPMSDIAVGFFADPDASDFYFVTLGENNWLAIYLLQNDQIFPLASNSMITSQNNVWYNIAILLSNRNIYVKRWEIDSGEPPDWQLWYLGATHFGDHIVLGGIAGTENEEFWFDNVACAPAYRPQLPSNTEGLVWYQGTTADPVTTATGNFTYAIHDLTVVSRTGVKGLFRFYNSIDSTTHPGAGLDSFLQHPTESGSTHDSR